MKILKLLLLLFISNYSYCQIGNTGFLFNKKTVTYYDNNPGVNYTISFNADTAVEMDNMHKIYVIDSLVIQARSNPIPKEMFNFKYDTLLESKLLLHFKDGEIDYQKKEIFKKRLKSKYEFFENSNAKKILIWYFKQPQTSEKERRNPYSKETLFSKDKIVTYQLYLCFTTNDNVTMINIPVFEGEDLEYKIKKIKTEIANTIRIYAKNINLEALYLQIKHFTNKTSYIINDTTCKIQFTIPYWLNIESEYNYDIIGLFPDIYNISNALLASFYKKSEIESIEALEDKMLKKNEIKISEKLNYINKNITRYKVIFTEDIRSSFTCQYVFLNLENYVGMIIFTATETTYDRNIDKFNEFIDSIHIY